MDKQDNPIDSLEQDLDAILRDSVNNPATEESKGASPAMEAPVPKTPAAPPPSAKPYSPPPAAAIPKAPDSGYFDQFSRETKKADNARDTQPRKSGPHWLNRYIPLILASGIGALLLLLAGALLTPWNFLAPSLQKQLSALLGLPVSITTIHVKVLPSPHLNMESIAIGMSHETHVAQLNLYPTFGWVMGDSKAINRLELDQFNGPTQQVEQILRQLARHDSKNGSVEEIAFTNATIMHGQLAWPAISGQLSFDKKGQVSKGQLGSSDGGVKVSFRQQENGYAFDANASGWTPPFADVFKFTTLSASGIAVPGSMQFSQLDGTFYGGSVKGSAQLSWDKDWRLRGELNLKDVDPATATPSLLPQTAFRGKLAAQLKFDTSAATPDKLWSTMNWQGTFALGEGMLANIDLPRAIQESGNLFSGGETRFTSLTGELTANPQEQLLSNLQLNSGLLAATGYIRLTRIKNLDGRLTAQIARPDSRFKTVLKLDGTIGAPNLRR